ncbi:MULTISPECIES: hypothetical protein [unclassified Streptomyces]|uniref:hypothetical protein n=1 Tax=unclassified Streptomyces TaxID=2593676 RepID=UPI00332A46ED
MPAPSTPASAAPPAPAPAVRSRRRARVPGPSAPLAPGAGGRRDRPGADAEQGAAGAGALGDPAGDVVRWAVFCCALVPLVLLAFGTSLGGAGGTALGLASVTAACRLLLRRAERGLRAGGAPGPGGRRRG